MANLGSALTFIGEGLANGALSSVVSFGAGFILDAIFGNPDQKILNELNELGQELNTIESTLVNIEDELDAISKELAKIAQEQLYQAWETRDNDVQEIITKIKAQFQTLIQFAKNAKDTSKEEVDELVSNILNTNSGALVNLEQLQTLVLGSGQDKGVLQLWTDMVAPLTTKNTFPIGKALNSYLKYYVHIVSAQMRAANLLVQAFNKQQSRNNAMDSYRRYRKIANSQEVPFIKNIDFLIRNSLSTGGTYGPIGQGNFSFQYEYLPLMQSYFAGGAFKGEYQPSPIHRQAEEILSSAQAMGPKERRIVVWMVYPANFAISAPPPPGIDFGNLNLKIVEVGTDRENSSNPTLSQNIPVITGESPHNIRRFVYETVKSGDYRMVDMNGSEYGLPPINGSAQKTVYFQEPFYLNYTLTVNNVTPFDFMDFLVYPDFQNTAFTTSGNAQNPLRFANI